MEEGIQTTLREAAKTGSGVVIPTEIFRAYDIRGIADEQLTVDNIRLIGFAIGQQAQATGIHTLLFATDARLSSPLLGPPLQQGILESGCHLVNLGIVPTPLLYFACHHTEFDSGVMLTASHNPAAYNGIKIVFQHQPLKPEAISRIGAIARERGLAAAGATTAVPGQLASWNILPDYLDEVSQRINLHGRHPRVVVDCGNAVPGLVAPALYERLGCEVIPLFCEPDGHFPNHHPDPTIPENLQALTSAVVAEEADLGIAMDGDGDRVVLVSGNGVTLDTDRLLMLLAQDILPRYKQPYCVFDVKCSSLLARIIRESGGQPVLSRSGHSFMKLRMRETGAVLGGEFSAHIFIRDQWYGFDDGLYVAARFLELLCRQDNTVDALLESLPSSVSTPELRIEIDESEKFALMDRIAALADFPGASVISIDGVRADFPKGWGLVRASNTTPAILLRFEAEDQVTLEKIMDNFRQLLEKADSRLAGAF